MKFIRLGVGPEGAASVNFERWADPIWTPDPVDQFLTVWSQCFSLWDDHWVLAPSHQFIANKGTKTKKDACCPNGGSSNKSSLIGYVMRKSSVQDSWQWHSKETSSWLLESKCWGGDIWHFGDFWTTMEQARQIGLVSEVLSPERLLERAQVRTPQIGRIHHWIAN